MAIRRTHALQRERTDGFEEAADEIGGYGPLGAHGVELPTEMAADRIAFLTFGGGGFFGA